MTARQRSLLYLEKLRILHAVVTIVLTIGLLGLGDRSVAAWGGHNRRRRAEPARSGLPFCTRRGISRWRWSM